ncbi:MAG: hypothetical protein MZU95_09610 [Desulfomicrobium escambiense]|nr:hypothetical protein [Desulfomicrobium escambiense]
MLDQVRLLPRKLLAHGLVANPAEAQLYGLDDEIYTNRDTVPGRSRLAVRCTEHQQPASSRGPSRFGGRIISELLRAQADIISPSDSESLTFIHDIPVVRLVRRRAGVAWALSRRKGCIVEGLGIITTGPYPWSRPS